MPDPPFPSHMDSSRQADVDSRGESATAPSRLLSSDSSTSLTTDETQWTENSDPSESEEDYYSSEVEEAPLKSKRILITDFISTDLPSRWDTSCGPFSELRETDQPRVQIANCACDLIHALCKIEGSPEPGGIALAIVTGHGTMFGDEQYLEFSCKSQCKRCVSLIPLSRVMDALHSTKKNIACALIACRKQVGIGIEDDISSSPSSLVTSRVSLVQPCGPGDVHKPGNLGFIDPTRELLLNTFDEHKPVRKAMEFLHGKFAYNKEGKKVNETSIDVRMHDEWMRHNDTNEDGRTLLDKLKELPPHEKLMALFAIYKDDTSHEERCVALEELRFHVTCNWDRIVATQSDGFKIRFFNDILEALTNEKDDKLMERLVDVTVEAAISSIDRKTGRQMWKGIIDFVENSFNSDNVSLKMISLSILSKVPNLFGVVDDAPLTFMKTALDDANLDIQSEAIKCLAAFLLLTSSAKIPWNITAILNGKAPPSEVFTFISSLEELTDGNLSILSVVQKGLQSTAAPMLKENMMASAMVRMEGGRIRHLHPKLDRESIADIVAILRSCSSSDSHKLKDYALQINSRFSAALASDPWAAADFFKNLLDDPNKDIRDSALTAYSVKIKANEEDLDLQSALISLLPTVIKLADNYDSSVWTSNVVPDILNHFFATNWEKSSEIIGNDGLSEVFKVLTQAVAASGLAEEKAKDDERSNIIRMREECARVFTLLAGKGDTRAGVVQFIKSSVISTNSHLKEAALRIIWNVYDIVESCEAPSLFEKILNDDDASIQLCAVKPFLAYTESLYNSSRVNEDSNKDLVNLLPVVIEIINKSASAYRYQSSLIDLLEACPSIIDVEHQSGLVECCMQVSVERGENQPFDELNTHSLDKILTALKYSNILETAIAVAHSFMQNDDWKTRYSGLNGLVSIAKQGHGSMKEHIEKMTTLLLDTNPRVRSLACLAVGEIVSLYQSELKDETHQMIIPLLIYTLNDEIPKVGDHAVKVLYKYIHICPKEVLLYNLNPLIDATLDFANKYIVSLPDTNYLGETFKLLFDALKAAEESIAPFYDKLIDLVKNCPKECFKGYDEVGPNAFNCISLVASAVGKDTFIKDFDELLRRFVGCTSQVMSGIPDWCSIVGIEFAPLLSLVIDDIVKKSSPEKVPPCPCGMCPGCGSFGWRISRTYEGDAVLTSLAKTLGESFAPYVPVVFKAVEKRLKHFHPSGDYWVMEFFPLLLDCLDSQGVKAKRAIWTKFVNGLKKSVKAVNKNKYSAKAMSSIVKSIEKLGSEGITKGESAAIGYWIVDEIDAIEKRRLERSEKIESVKEGGEEWTKYEEDKEFESGAIEALKTVCQIGAKLLHSSYGTLGDRLAEMTGEGGEAKIGNNNNEKIAAAVV